MSATNNRLAPGNRARLVFATAAAGALTAGAAAPAQADDEWGRRGGIGAGEIIAGAVVIGGIAALAGAFDGDRRGWDGRDFDRRDWDRRNFDRRDFDRRGWDGGFGGNPRAAVERCVRAAENQARRFGGWRFADVVDVRDIDRTRFGFQVRGRIEVQDSGRWGGRAFDRGSFNCRLDGRGQPLIDFDGIRGLR